MTQIKIGIIKEGKIPIDKRVPLIPVHARQLQDAYPNVEIVCQRSDIRCYSDQEYENHKIPLVDDVSDCDILIGVKEVPLEDLIPGKTYFFFSHTIKMQAYNRQLLQSILNNNIRLIDYECLTDNSGKRIIAFGRYAGIVGAYNGILTFGLRYNLFHLKRAVDCFDLEALQHEFKKAILPKIKIALTGGGRVAKGAMEVLIGMGIRRISPESFLQREFNEPVFTQLNARDYNEHRDGNPFHRNEFYSYPDHFVSTFLPFAKEADILIAGAYWDPRAPVLFTKEDILHRDFSIKVIADITCDIEGSIPSTKRSSTITSPFYDYNPDDDKVEPPFGDEANITVMAVDNLPCELSRDASADFSEVFASQVLPQLIDGDHEEIIKRATITENGKLTKAYNYLTEFIQGE